jgi:hypothetical protein
MEREGGEGVGECLLARVTATLLFNHTPLPVFTRRYNRRIVSKYSKGFSLQQVQFRVKME